jgi:hypothetical protein
MLDQSPKNTLYFIDYEFLNSDDNGLRFIVENKIESKAILVTSRADEEVIRLACFTSCIKLLPKAMVSSLPVVTGTKIKPDAVLVEDDEMVISTWLHSAKRYNRDVRAFSNRADLLLKIENYDLDTQFYLDSRLKDDRGEEVAKILYNKGFRQLYIASGNSELMPGIENFVVGVVSKSPPWINGRL